jgi:hypothetical protein
MASTSELEGQEPLSDEEKRKKYEEFEAKVKRTVYIEHLSPQVINLFFLFAFVTSMAC